MQAGLNLEAPAVETRFADHADAVIEYLAASACLDPWEAAHQTVLELVSSDQPWLLSLPMVACQAVGGDPALAVPTAAAWAALRHAANLLDAVQDGDEIPAATIGAPGEIISLATGMVFAAYRLMKSSHTSPSARQRALALLSEAGLQASYGQYLGLVNRGEAGSTEIEPRLEGYWRAVILKSGSIYQAGAACGAAAGTDSEELITALGDFGRALGVIRQILDDCRDVVVDRAALDSELTLPWLLYALVMQSRSQAGGTALFFEGEPDDEGRGGALHEAGVPGIIADIVEEWRRRALDSLSILEPSQAADALKNILQRVPALEPVPEPLARG